MHTHGGPGGCSAASSCPARNGARLYCTWRAHGVPLVCHRALPRIHAAARPRGATALLRALVAPDSAGRVDCHVVQPSKLGRSCVRGCLQSMQRERQTPSKDLRWHLDNEAEVADLIKHATDTDHRRPRRRRLRRRLQLAALMLLMMNDDDDEDGDDTDRQRHA